MCIHHRQAVSRCVSADRLPVFLAAADGTVASTALPAIASLGQVELLSWLVVANMIANNSAAPAYGRLGDLFGR